MSDSIDTDIANEKVSILLDQCREILCKEAVDEVFHYIKHNEPEIAFEGLFIEVMQLGYVPQGLDKAGCIDLGKYLRLDRESVLDDDFWRKFVAYLQ